LWLVNPKFHTKPMEMVEESSSVVQFQDDRPSGDIPANLDVHRNCADGVVVGFSFLLCGAMVFSSVQQARQRPNPVHALAGCTYRRGQRLHGGGNGPRDCSKAVDHAGRVCVDEAVSC
jgi:hypothetical protein